MSNNEVTAIELSGVGNNTVYESLQDTDNTAHTYATAGPVEAETVNYPAAVANSYSSNSKENGTMRGVKLSKRTVCVLAVFGILLLCTLCSIITGVIVYFVTSAKFEQDNGRSLKSGQDLNHSQVTVADLKALEDRITRANENRVTRVNDELKEQLESMKSNQTQSRDSIADIMDQLDNFGNNITHTIQERLNASGKQVAFYAHSPTGNPVEDCPTFKTIVENIGGG